MDPPTFISGLGPHSATRFWKFQTERLLFPKAVIAMS